jgi:hypothetical protein
VLLYQVDRRRSEHQYVHKLDEPLQPAQTRDLNEIRSRLTTWLASYRELDVPASYGGVYEKVEGVLGEAHELADRFPDMTAVAFQGDLASLQAKLWSIEPIGRSAYSDKHPWLIGYALAVFKIIGMVILSMVLVLVIVCIGAAFSVATQANAASKSSSGSAHFSDGGVDYARAYGGGPPEMSPYEVMGERRPYYKNPFGPP